MSVSALLGYAAAAGTALGTGGGLVLAQVGGDPIITASGAGVIASSAALMIWVGRKLLSGELVAKQTEQQLVLAQTTIDELRRQGEADRGWRATALDRLRTQHDEMRVVLEANTGALAVAHSVLLQLGVESPQHPSARLRHAFDRATERTDP